MWKFVSRYSRELCWNNKRPCSSKLRTEQQRQICCFTQDGHCKGKKDDSKEKQGRRPTWDTSQIQQHSWLGALGWSGVLVVGWYLSQPTRLRTLLGKPVKRDDHKYESLSNVLLYSVLAQPVNNVLPKSLAPKEESQCFREDIVPKEDIGSKEDTSRNLISETLDQAAENLAQVHGSVENRLAMELARRKHHKEAAILFQKAAERGHSSAAFNLGLCYEQGLGTVQDFRKAAECYEMAANSGHPSAIYNLGVFYVHGWGGKKADRAQARQLFVTAARLGQAEARKALGMADKKTSVPEIDLTSNHHVVQDSIANYAQMLEV